MSDFKADAKVISNFGEELAELATEATKAKNYAEDHVKAGRGESGIFQQIVGVLEQAQGTLSGNYDRLHKLQNSAATEVDNAAMMYDGTDNAEAERMDNTYPEAGA